MLRTKISLFFLSFVLIIAVTAFISPVNNTKETKKETSNVRDPYSYYFQYVGPLPESYSDYIDSNNYIMLPGGDDPTVELCEYGYETLCAILCERYFDGYAYRPDFDAAPYTGSTKQQLYFYSISGIPSGAIFLKNL
ncbi:hypothetical protein D3C87_1242190 [compost metagenome]